MTAITLVLLMASVLLTLYTPAKAQYTNMQEGGSIRLPAGVTPDVTITATAYMSFRPNPVGVGQTILVNVWTTLPLHVSRYHTDYTITITDPDGNEDVITVDSYRADATAWFEYVVDQVGTWTLKFDFLGGYFPAGNYTVYGGAWIGPQVISFEESTYYTPDSTEEQTLTVQEDPVLSWPPSDLPTDYWTRPVTPEHREWWPILGYFPATGVPGGGPIWDELYPDTNTYMSNYDFIPYIQAPNTAHVLWKRQDTISGLIGGVAGQKSWTNNGNPPSMIYAGRCYQTFSKFVDGESVTVWQCYDLRTGEVYWEYPVPVIGYGFFGPITATPNFIMYEEGLSEVPGADPLYGRNIWLCQISGSNLLRWNPATGVLSQNISIAPLTSGTLYANPNFLTVQNLGGGNYRLIEWTIENVQTGFLGYIAQMKILNNITWPWSNLGDSQDFEAGIAFDTYSISPQPAGIATQTGLRAASLKTGAELWDKVVDVRTYSGSCTVADHGKGAILVIGGYFLAYDLQTGNLAWKSETMDYPWGAPSFGAYDITSAYGMFYRQAYDGVYAFDWDDGSIVWKYKHPTPYEYETPYIDETGDSVYSFNSGAVAIDGKIFTYNSEHTATQPITRGWKWHCIDAFTGKGIWNFTGNSGFAEAAFGDGYACIPNAYDGYMYVIGKGKSQTTVEAPLTAIPLGQSIMIKGTVLDMSPAQPETPCVSKESMSGWMDYLHMQRPIPADVTGVPVSLDTIDPNGNFIHIGDVSSDMSGMFKKMWTPEITGEYTVIATFMGDDSYGSSYAETAVGVVEALEPYPEPPEYGSPEWPEYPEAPAYTAVDLVLILVAIVTVCLVLYTLWTVKKQR